MKKLFALLLTVALLFGSAAMAEYDYTGLWTLIGAEVAGTFVDATAIGLDASMLLKEDGSCVLTMQGEAGNGTWLATTDGVIVTDAAGVTDTIKLVDNNLVVEQESVKFIFTRGAEEGINYVGTWSLTGMEIDGLAQDLAARGISGGMVLNEDGSCVLTKQDVTYNGTWAANETGITTYAEGYKDTFTLVDGKLVAEAESMKWIFTRGTDMETQMNTYVGEWTLSSVEVNGTAQEPSTLGLSISVVLNKDGTCVMTSQDETQNGTWEATETGVTATEEGGGVDTFMLVNGKLVVETRRMKLIFSQGTERGTEKVNYVGEWALTSVKVPDMELDSALLSQYGVGISLSIREDGTLSLTIISEDGDETGECTWEETEGGIVITDTTGESLAFTLMDGALVVEQDDMAMVFTPVEPAE